MTQTTPGATIRVSVDNSGAQANGASITSKISSDGRYVAFTSNATNLLPGETNTFVPNNVYVRDLQAGTTQWVSESSSGGRANEQSTGGDTL